MNPDQNDTSEKPDDDVPRYYKAHSIQLAQVFRRVGWVLALAIILVWAAGFLMTAMEQE